VLDCLDIMAATSGIGVSEELTQAFSVAVETKNVRFIKVNIENESLVPVASVSVSGTLDDDLALLQDHLEENVPCYVLTRLDNPPSEWLIISYVPDAAQVRQKVIAGLD
jgi:twinfilin-like protein